jgi:hypothetical protein
VAGETKTPEALNGCRVVKCSLRRYVAFDCGSRKIVRSVDFVVHGWYYITDVIFYEDSGIVELKEAIIDNEELLKAELKHAKIVFRTHVDRDKPGALSFLHKFRRAFEGPWSDTINELHETLTYLCPASTQQQ